MSQGSCQAENASFQLVPLLLLPATADFDNAGRISFFFFNGFFFPLMLLACMCVYVCMCVCMCVCILILQSISQISLGSRMPIGDT